MRPKRSFETIDQYIEPLPADVQRRLEQLRQAIHSAAPQAREAISYGIPAFRLNGTLVYFGAFKNHIGFYPTSSGIRAFQKQLSPYKLTRGAVQFPLDKPIPVALVKSIVRFRGVENAKKAAKKK
ncbi:MAG: DUF1801 domain-containing protein [Candidatus Eremiobacteraeota bacterium]|nr:DUF1801 domain-containing protein [Candidatus Eremiobacteraeota bacterium]